MAINRPRNDHQEHTTSRAFVMNIKNILSIIRPHQWIKNVFVMVPLFFGGSLLDSTDIIASLIAVLAFSFIASSIYCLNDIIDVEDDRRHPVKCNRPIASGKVSVKQGYVCMAMMVALSFGLTTLIGEQAMGVAAALGTYFLLNIAYCLWLKRFAIVDVCVIAFGFVLRLLVGGLATCIELSNWIVLMTFLLTLFLSLAKRRDDVVRMNETGSPHTRPSHIGDYGSQYRYHVHGMDHDTGILVQYGERGVSSVLHSTPVDIQEEAPLCR